MVTLALFCLWIIFNGKVTLELIIFGIVISVALSWFVKKFIAPSMNAKNQWKIFKYLPGYLQYVWLLIKEITLANFAVMRMILTDKDVVVPKLSVFKTKLKTKTARVALADCITLTPGTITVNLNADEYLVHCLDESLEDGLINSEFEKRLLDKEAKWFEEKQL